MVQGMKRQNGISKMESINMGDEKKENLCQGTGLTHDIADKNRIIEANEHSEPFLMWINGEPYV